VGDRGGGNKKKEMLLYHPSGWGIKSPGWCGGGDVEEQKQGGKAGAA